MLTFFLFIALTAVVAVATWVWLDDLGTEYAAARYPAADDDAWNEHVWSAPGMTPIHDELLADMFRKQLDEGRQS